MHFKVQTRPWRNQQKSENLLWLISLTESCVDCGAYFLCEKDKKGKLLCQLCDKLEMQSESHRRQKKTLGFGDATNYLKRIIIALTKLTVCAPRFMNVYNL